MELSQHPVLERHPIVTDLALETLRRHNQHSEGGSPGTVGIPRFSASSDHYELHALEVEGDGRCGDVVVQLENATPIARQSVGDFPALSPVHRAQLLAVLTSADRKSGCGLQVEHSGMNEYTPRNVLCFDAKGTDRITITDLHDPAVARDVRAFINRIIAVLSQHLMDPAKRERTTGIMGRVLRGK